MALRFVAARKPGLLVVPPGLKGKATTSPSSATM
jgi:hypothetical protein